MRWKFIRYHIDGVGFRRIGRQLGVNCQSAANWVKEHVESLPKAATPHQVKSAEFDELYIFYWVIKPLPAPVSPVKRFCRE